MTTCEVSDRRCRCIIPAHFPADRARVLVLHSACYGVHTGIDTWGSSRTILDSEYSIRRFPCRPLAEGLTAEGSNQAEDPEAVKHDVR